MGKVASGRLRRNEACSVDGLDTIHITTTNFQAREHGEAKHKDPALIVLTGQLPLVAAFVNMIGTSATAGAECGQLHKTGALRTKGETTQHGSTLVKVADGVPPSREKARRPPRRRRARLPAR